jgi:hypothetical protein
VASPGPYESGGSEAATGGASQSPDALSSDPAKPDGTRTPDGRGSPGPGREGADGGQPGGQGATGGGRGGSSGDKSEKKRDDDHGEKGEEGGKGGERDQRKYVYPLCRDYVVGKKPRMDPGTLRWLERAAGGPAKVHAFCRQYLEQGYGGSGSGGSESNGRPKGGSGRPGSDGHGDGGRGGNGRGDGHRGGDEGEGGGRLRAPGVTFFGAVTQ